MSMHEMMKDAKKVVDESYEKPTSLGEKIMKAYGDALDKDVTDEEMKKVLEKFKDKFTFATYEDLEDNNYHTANKIITDMLGGYNTWIKTQNVKESKGTGPKYKMGDKVYSYQNPDKAMPVNRIHVSDDPEYAHKYQLALKDDEGYTKSSKWIDEPSLSKSPIKENVDEAKITPNKGREFAKSIQDLYKKQGWSGDLKIDAMDSEQKQITLDALMKYQEAAMSNLDKEYLEGLGLNDIIDHVGIEFKEEIEESDKKIEKYEKGKFYQDKGVYKGIEKNKHVFQRHNADNELESEYGPKFYYEDLEESKEVKKENTGEMEKEPKVVKENTEKKKYIRVVKGDAKTPERFWERGFVPADKFNEYKAKGFVHSKSDKYDSEMGDKLKDIEIVEPKEDQAMWHENSVTVKESVTEHASYLV